MALRLATPMDTPALVGIYGQYIHTPITFEYELPSPREFQNRITHTLEGYPYLVWEENGTPVGYATASKSGPPTSGVPSCPSMWPRATPPTV